MNAGLGNFLFLFHHFHFFYFFVIIKTFSNYRSNEQQTTQMFQRMQKHKQNSEKYFFLFHEIICNWMNISDLHEPCRISLLYIIIPFENAQYVLSFMVGDAIENLLWLLQQIRTIDVLCISRCWIGRISGRRLHPMNGGRMCWCWRQASASTASHFPTKNQNHISFILCKPEKFHHKPNPFINNILIIFYNNFVIKTSLHSIFVQWNNCMLCKYSVASQIESKISWNQF